MEADDRGAGAGMASGNPVWLGAVVEAIGSERSGGDGVSAWTLRFWLESPVGVRSDVQ